MKGFLGTFLVFVFWVSGGIYYISKTSSSLSTMRWTTAIEDVSATKNSNSSSQSIQETNRDKDTTRFSLENGENNAELDSVTDPNNSSNSQLLADELKKSITISDTIDISKGEPEFRYEDEIVIRAEETKTPFFYPRYTVSQELILDEKLVAYATELKQLLKESPDKKITIIGHTDNVGDAKDNFEIALKKSRQVKWYLTTRRGLPRSRVKAISKGEHKPIESNNSNWGRRKNNRIEIIVE